MPKQDKIKGKYITNVVKAAEKVSDSFHKDCAGNFCMDNISAGAVLELVRAVDAMKKRR